MVIFGVGAIFLWLEVRVGVGVGVEVELETLESSIKVGGVGLARFLSIY